MKLYIYIKLGVRGFILFFVGKLYLTLKILHFDNPMYEIKISIVL